MRDALCLLDVNAVLQASEDAKPAELRVSERPGVVHRVRQPQIGRAAWLDPSEGALRDADNFELASLEREPTSKD